MRSIIVSAENSDRARVIVAPLIGVAALIGIAALMGAVWA
jgi:hypothetical protein